SDFDDLHMTITNAAPDAGATTADTQLIITDPNSPLAAGKTGTITVCTTADAFRWGNPSGATSGAIRVAGIVNTEHEYGIFAYDTGATMEGITAPARRVGFFLGDYPASSSLTQDGIDLFMAAATWASHGTVAPPPPVNAAHNWTLY